MTKYYRVRTQEQWDWLSHRWLDAFQTELQFDRPHIIAFYGGQVYGICDQHKGPEPVIEVSDLMEDERMKDYVTISGDNLDKVRFIENNSGFAEHNKISNVRKLLIPKSLLYPKVRMSVAEKEEFDKLKDEMSLDRHDLDDLLTRIKDSEDFPFLYHRLYVADGDGVESQLEFARAWADPSLIEVILEKKWNVKVPGAAEYILQKEFKSNCKPVIFDYGEFPDCQFTAEELKQYGLDGDLFEKVEVQE